MGFPLVRVEQKQLDGDLRELTFHQTRFLADGGVDAAKPLWKIPIGVLTPGQNGKKQKTTRVMTQFEQSFIFMGVKPGDWIKVRCSNRFKGTN